MTTCPRLFPHLFVYGNTHGKIFSDSQHTYDAVTRGHRLPSFQEKLYLLKGRVYIVLLDHSQHVHSHG